MSRYYFEGPEVRLNYTEHALERAVERGLYEKAPRSFCVFETHLEPVKGRRFLAEVDGVHMVLAWMSGCEAAVVTCYEVNR
jgi:hypothetical protein